MRVVLIRHGQTAWNQKNVAIGQTDVDLNEDGLRQLAYLEQRFRGIKFSKIYCSDLKRCLLTGEAVSRATGVPLEIRTEVRERSFGDWEGRDYAEVSAELLRMSREQGVPLYDVRPPNGESHRDIWNRVRPVVDPLFTAEEDVCIVTHGGTSRVLLSQIICANLDTTFCFKFDNTAVTQLDRRVDGAFLVTLYNDTSHLAADLVTHEPGHVAR
ncbi:MAG TPA: histidine phosphatase family protein [Fimbriimonas sp.]|nr:histidine phosphatase family protein [Fimbriimonas sp.]